MLYLCASSLDFLEFALFTTARGLLVLCVNTSTGSKHGVSINHEATSGRIKHTSDRFDDNEDTFLMEL
jgi:hypothetical protein